MTHRMQDQSRASTEFLPCGAASDAPFATMVVVMPSVTDHVSQFGVASTRPPMAVQASATSTIDPQREPNRNSFAEDLQREFRIAAEIERSTCGLKDPAVQEYLARRAEIAREVNSRPNVSGEELRSLLQWAQCALASARATLIEEVEDLAVWGTIMRVIDPAHRHEGLVVPDRFLLCAVPETQEPYAYSDDDLRVDEMLAEMLGGDDADRLAG